jgi:hypothetical protein
VSVAVAPQVAPRGAVQAARQADPGGAPAGLPGRWRRLRFPVLVGLAVVTAATLAALAVGGSSTGDLDPVSGSRSGSRAVAEILRRQGVAVTRTADPARAAQARGTLVVVRSELLPPGRLGTAAAQAARLVLVEPAQRALDAVAPGVRGVDTAPAATVPPQCAAQDAQAGPARAGGRSYAVRTGVRADVCFPAPGVGAGSLVELDGTGNGGNTTVVVLGQGDVLRNGHLADDANAALALRVLGHDRDLVWLVPDPAQAGDAGPASLRDLLPPWFWPAVVQVVLAVLLGLLWQGRRLGPVVTEPLPVVVRAGETLQGRARLYRRARAVDRAAASLRTAALRRLARRLAVPVNAAPDAVAVRAAQATDREPDDVRRVLLGGAPGDERELVRLADELDALERDVVAAGTAQQRGEDRR